MGFGEAQGAASAAIGGTSGQWSVDASGDLVPATDNADDIGDATYRPRTVRAATSVVTPKIDAAGQLRLHAAEDIFIATNPGTHDYDINLNGYNFYLTPTGPDGVKVVGHISGAEIADPAAPAANTGILYFRDNGAGKTQLVARFPTGAVQVIATEP